MNPNLQHYMDINIRHYYNIYIAFCFIKLYRVVTAAGHVIKQFPLLQVCSSGGAEQLRVMVKIYFKI